MIIYARDYAFVGVAYGLSRCARLPTAGELASSLLRKLDKSSFAARRSRYLLALRLCGGFGRASRIDGLDTSAAAGA